MRSPRRPDWGDEGSGLYRATGIARALDAALNRSGHVAVLARGSALSALSRRYAHTGVPTMPTRRPQLIGRWPVAAAVLLATLAAPASPSLFAQDVAQQGALKEILAKETFIRPPAAIEKVVTAPWQQNVSLTNQSPDHKHFLKLETEGMPSVQQFGKPHYYLAGLQVDYKANRARILTTRGAAGLEVIDGLTGQLHAIETPKGATISSPKWSPDGSELAYLANFDDATHIYVADVASGKSRKITRTPLLATLVTTVEWTNGGKSIVA